MRASMSTSSKSRSLPLRAAGAGAPPPELLRRMAELRAMGLGGGLGARTSQGSPTAGGAKGERKAKAVRKPEQIREDRALKDKMSEVRRRMMARDAARRQRAGTEKAGRTKGDTFVGAAGASVPSIQVRASTPKATRKRSAFGFRKGFLLRSNSGKGTSSLGAHADSVSGPASSSASKPATSSICTTSSQASRLLSVPPPAADRAFRKNPPRPVPLHADLRAPEKPLSGPMEAPVAAKTDIHACEASGQACEASGSGGKTQSKGKKSSRSRCAVCRKAVGLAMTFKCRCGNVYCGAHRHAEAHQCTFDYKSLGRSMLNENLPRMDDVKLSKI